MKILDAGLPDRLGAAPRKRQIIRPALAADTRFRIFVYTASTVLLSTITDMVNSVRTCL